MTPYDHLDTPPYIQPKNTKYTPPYIPPETIGMTEMLKYITEAYGRDIKVLGDKNSSATFDAQILAQLAYLPTPGDESRAIWNRYFDEDDYKGIIFEAKTIGEIADYFLNKEEGQNLLKARCGFYDYTKEYGNYLSNAQVDKIADRGKNAEYYELVEFLNAIAECPRYSDLYVLDLAYDTSAEGIPTESTAYVFSPQNPAFVNKDKISDIYIAYRGTPPTWIGWMEDMYYAFISPPTVPYLRKFTLETLETYGAAKYNMTCHSKGCNPMLIAAADTYDAHGSRLENIYAFDGPKYAPKVFDAYVNKFEAIAEKMHFIYPENSVVGQLAFFFDNPGKFASETYVKADESKGIFAQHTFPTWRFYNPAYNDSKGPLGYVIGEQSQFSKDVELLVRQLLNTHNPERFMNLIPAAFLLLGKNNDISMWSREENETDNQVTLRTIETALDAIRDYDDEDIDDLAGLIKSIVIAGRSVNYDGKPYDPSKEQWMMLVGPEWVDINTMTIAQINSTHMEAVLFYDGEPYDPAKLQADTTSGTIEKLATAFMGEEGGLNIPWYAVPFINNFSPKTYEEIVKNILLALREDLNKKDSTLRKSIAELDTGNGIDLNDSYTKLKLLQALNDVLGGYDTSGIIVQPAIKLIITGSLNQQIKEAVEPVYQRAVTRFYNILAEIDDNKRLLDQSPEKWLELSSTEEWRTAHPELQKQLLMDEYFKQNKNDAKILTEYYGSSFWIGDMYYIQIPSFTSTPTPQPISPIASMSAMPRSSGAVIKGPQEQNPVFNTASKMASIPTYAAAAPASASKSTPTQAISGVGRELNEKELLLLDNLMYLDFCDDVGSKYKTVGGLVEHFLQAGKVQPSLLSGGFESRPEDFKAILQEIQNSDQLCKLTITNPLEGNGVRAACFVAPDTSYFANGDYQVKKGSVTVAVRGTGGIYDAWQDNLKGAGVVATPMQIAFAEYIKSLPYSNLTVTGHSKGGNLAMYATIICADKIRSCISYDGQGFSKKFIEEYWDKIKSNQNKITSISAYNDFVNILMFSIAGKTFYVRNDGGLPQGHDSDRLCWDNSFDPKTGKFSSSSIVAQSDPMKAFGDMLRELIYNASDSELEMISDVLGVVVAPFFSKKDFDISNIDDYNKAEELIINALNEYYKREGKTDPEIVKQKTEEIMSMIKLSNGEESLAGTFYARKYLRDALGWMLNSSPTTIHMYDGKPYDTSKAKWMVPVGPEWVDINTMTVAEINEISMEAVLFYDGERFNISKESYVTEKHFGGRIIAPPPAPAPKYTPPIPESDRALSELYRLTGHAWDITMMTIDERVTIASALSEAYKAAKDPQDIKTIEWLIIFYNLRNWLNESDPLFKATVSPATKISSVSVPPLAAAPAKTTVSGSYAHAVYAAAAPTAMATSNLYASTSGIAPFASAVDLSATGSSASSATGTVDKWKDVEVYTIYPHGVKQEIIKQRLDLGNGQISYRLFDPVRGIAVYDCNHNAETMEVGIEPNVDGVFNYEMAKPALENMILTYDFYTEALGRKSYADSAPINIYINYKINTAYNGNGNITYAYNKSHSIKSLDVAVHEFTHGVTTSISKPGLKQDPAYVMEAYGDLMGMFAMGIDRNKTERWQFSSIPDHNYSMPLSDEKKKDVSYYERWQFCHAAYKMITDKSTKDITDEEWAKIFYNSMGILGSGSWKLEYSAKAVLLSAVDEGFSKEQLQAIVSAFVAAGILDSSTQCTVDQIVKEELLRLSKFSMVTTGNDKFIADTLSERFKNANLSDKKTIKWLTNHYMLRNLLSRDDPLYIATASPVSTPEYKVGDVVQFTGGLVYSSSDIANAAAIKSGSVCKITAISADGKRYHLVSDDGKGVHGWVSAVNASPGPPSTSVSDNGNTNISCLGKPTMYASTTVLTSTQTSDFGKDTTTFLSAPIQDFDAKTSGSVAAPSGIVGNPATIADSGKTAVNLKELRRLKTLAEDLLEEVNRHSGIVSRARSDANSAANSYNESYVRNAANKVLNACSLAESEKSRISAELRDMIYGLDKTIEGYARLEYELSR